jgi:hypothetical protein
MEDTHPRAFWAGRCDGWYDVDGDTATFTTPTKITGGDCAPPSWTARWAIQDGNLHWTAVSVADFSFVWAGKPWQRIG